MKFLKPLLLISGIALLSFTTMESGGFQQWSLIGEKKVSFLVDKDVMQVTGGGNYSQIKFKAKDGPVHLLNVSVHLENGDKIDVPINQKFPNGSESPVIDLPGSRNIKKIELWYEMKGFSKGKGRVQVWGKR